jgi:hypothetical protein
MTCPKATCGKAMGEDEKFGYDMRLLGLPQRRYYCSDGHSLTTGIPAAADLEPKIVPGQYRHLAGQTRRLANLQPEAPKVPRLENVCRNGHPRTEENTHVGPDGRRCRVCQRDFVAFRRSQSTACRRGPVYTPLPGVLGQLRGGALEADAPGRSSEAERSRAGGETATTGARLHPRPRLWRIEPLPAGEVVRGL